MGTEVPLLTLSPHSLMSWGEKCVKQKLLLTGSFCPCCFLVKACCGTDFALAQMAKWTTQVCHFNHRMTEQPRLEGTSTDYLVPPFVGKRD